MTTLPLLFNADESGFRFQFVDALIASHLRRLFMVYLSSLVEPDADLFSVELIFGELVGNVAQHAPGPLEVRILWEGDDARLEVIDRGPGYALRPTLPDDFDEAHRGLFIVAAYGRDLRVERRRTRTVTSVGLPVKRRTFAT
jgi:anti-sigma regulatory factor (Ser/Thr protein kinase)